MRRLLAVGILGALGLIACDSSSPSGPSNTPPVVSGTPTPAPTPTPNPSLVGLWRVVRIQGYPNLGPLDGYSIDISTHNTTTGEIRGRSVYKLRGLNGPLRGTARGNHIDWQVDFGDGDSENGSMDITPDRRDMEGFVKYEFPTIRQSFSYGGVLLRKE